MRESDIVHETGRFWVARDRAAYTVYKNGLTHSTADSAYPKTDDGLSIAIARANYLARRMAQDVITSDARKICRAFDAAEERESTEIGL